MHKTHIFVFFVLGHAGKLSPVFRLGARNIAHMIVEKKMVTAEV